MVFITLQSIGENEYRYGKTGHSKIFTFWGIDIEQSLLFLMIVWIP